MHSSEPLYYARDGKVWKRPVEKRNDNGTTSCSMGFPVCTMHDCVGPDAAQALADMMNKAAALEAHTSVADILTERGRQVTAEGWQPAHDDNYAEGTLARAASAYALSGAETDAWRARYGLDNPPALWPRGWGERWWKPKDRRRDLVRAGALIAAEIDRLDRAAKQ